MTGAIVFVAATLAAVTHADEPQITVTLVPPERIAVGDRVQLVAEVRITPRNGFPVLLTPSNQGSSIEVARGRLVRADAVDPDAMPLVFRVPLIANEPGTAIVRIAVLGYACESRCRTVTTEAQVALTVVPAS